MNVLATIWTALVGAFTKNAMGIFVTIPTSFVMALVNLAEDEISILVQSVRFLIAQLQKGVNFSDALTATYNQFYNMELSEGHKVSMAFLEWLANALSGLSPSTT